MGRSGRRRAASSSPAPPSSASRDHRTGRHRRAGCLAAPREARRPPRRPPPPLDPAWFADRPRFEPLDGAPLTVTGARRLPGRHRDHPAGRTKRQQPRRRQRRHHRGLRAGRQRGPDRAGPSRPRRPRPSPPAPTPSTKRPATTDRHHLQAAGADICATQGCQVYAGLAKERREGGQTWLAAVAQTKGQVLLYKNAPINAKYSSSNGGQTVGGGQPYLQPIARPRRRLQPAPPVAARTYAIGDVVRVAGLAGRARRAPPRRHPDRRHLRRPRRQPGRGARAPSRTSATASTTACPRPQGLPLPLPERPLRRAARPTAPSRSTDGAGATASASASTAPSARRSGA